MAGSFVLIVSSSLIAYTRRKMLYTCNYRVDVGTTSESTGRKPFLIRLVQLPLSSMGLFFFDTNIVLMNYDAEMPFDSVRLLVVLMVCNWLLLSS